jgi:hypothetical protein
LLFHTSRIPLAERVPINDEQAQPLQIRNIISSYHEHLVQHKSACLWWQFVVPPHALTMLPK